MHKDLRRSLFTAFLGATVAGCGGSATAPAPSGGGGPPPPPPPPSGAGSYFLTGHADSGFNGNGIPFLDGTYAQSPFALNWVDPLAMPSPPPATLFETSGATLDVSSVSEWTRDTSGNASSWGVRYRVYAKGTSLYRIDLRKGSGTPPPAPASTQLSNVVIGTTTSTPPGSTPQICYLNRQLFDNYPSADQSWLVFHAKGTNDTDCSTSDDQFVAVQMTMGPTSAPLQLKQLEPVEALRDATGKVTGYLAINHPVVAVGAPPPTNIPLQQLDATFTASKTFTATLAGTGVNASTGDFVSLGVSPPIAGTAPAPSGVWLYADTSNVWALDIANNFAVQVFAIGAGDRVAYAPAVFGSSKAYVAVNNATTGGYVLMIDLTTLHNTTPTFAKSVDAAATTSLSLVGVGSASGNVVYLYTPVVTGGTSAGIKTVVGTLASPAVSLLTLSASQSVDAPLGSPLGTPAVAYLVQDQVYFTVVDSSTPNANRLAYTGPSSGATQATRIGTGSGAVIGLVAGTFATSAPVLYSGALVLTVATPSGALSFSNASLANYSPSGTLFATLGTMPNDVNPITAVAVSALPVQNGVPAMLELTGGNSNAIGAQVDDLEIFVPDAGSSLVRVTTLTN